MKTLPQIPAAVHAGVDVSKATLQLHLQGRQRVLPNTPAGHRSLLALLRPVPAVHIVCEATGGYEQAMVARLHALDLPVTVVNPAQVRYFALAQGRRAKSDPIDAAVLTAYGQAIQPTPTPAPDVVLAELRTLIQWRAALKVQLGAVRNQGEHATSPFVVRQQAVLIKHISQQIKTTETELASALKRSPKIQAQVRELAQLDGVGTLTAVSVLSQMPELGRLNRGQTAALAGLAPWTRQSGPWEGQRHIGGGRSALRRCLYMSAVSLARKSDTHLGKFYLRLRTAGKPAKVALTAVMRKLLLQMNQVIKNHLALLPLQKT